LDPQRKLKLGTMAAGPGEGAREVSEWKVAQDSIIKLQRATRGRILKGLNDQLEAHFEVCEYSQTLSHRDYKKNSQQYLGPFIKELVKVNYSLLLPLVHAMSSQRELTLTLEFDTDFGRCWWRQPLMILPCL